MAIIKVNNTSEESSVNFLTNQSSILYTLDTNKITVNGVNVFVDKPKVGDIMCVTRYTGDGGALLPADKQKVKWIDGLSINTKQLSQKYEPVGICVAINGNKAMVRYREEQTKQWSASERWEMPQLLPIINQKSHSFRIKLNGTNNPNLFEYHYNSLSSTFEQEADFVDQLNDWFLANACNYSAELVDDNEQPIVSGALYYRIIVNASITRGAWNTFSMDVVDDGTDVIHITPTRSIGKPVEAVNQYYKNNGFTAMYYAGCCRAKYYEYIQKNQKAPTEEMTSINSIPSYYADWPLSKLPAKKADFDNDSNCKILRDNFANYDEYLESWMVKFPCGAGGQITEFPSGKENTYKLANCTFSDITTGTAVRSTLYPAANYAANINVNGPNLGKGNWWLPSPAEMVQMMRDITFGTSFWETKPDIVNRVLKKLTSITDSGWSMLSAYPNRWTPSRCDENSVYDYSGTNGSMATVAFFGFDKAAPITLYEF